MSPLVEIHVVGLAAVVVSVEVTEVLQLPEACVVAAHNTREPRHEALSAAGVAPGTAQALPRGERVEGGPKGDRSKPDPERNVVAQGANFGGIETGVLSTTAFRMSGSSMNPHICSTRVMMSRACPGFSPAIIQLPRDRLGPNHINICPHNPQRDHEEPYPTHPTTTRSTMKTAHPHAPHDEQGRARDRTTRGQPSGLAPGTRGDGRPRTGPRRHAGPSFAAPPAVTDDPLEPFRRVFWGSFPLSGRAATFHRPCTGVARRPRLRD